MVSDGERAHCPILPLLLCFVGLLVFGGCAGRSGTVLREEGPEVRFTLSGGVPVNERELSDLISGADYVLVGERHTSPADHLAQARLIDLLARKGGRRLLIGLEMLPRRYYDFQLAAFGQGRIALADLPEALNWKNTWGYDFALYRPIFATAQKFGLPMHGLNLPDVIRRSVSRKGLAALSEAEKSELPKRIVPPLPEQRERLLEAFRMHRPGAVRRPAGIAAGRADVAAGKKGQDGVSARAKPAVMRQAASTVDPAGREASALFERFLLIQSLWDSTMAERAVELRNSARIRRKGSLETGNPAVLILAGAGHVEYGHGIASRIRLLDPDARVLLVLPLADGTSDQKAADLFYSN